MADLEDVTLDGKPLQSLRVADLKAALQERRLSKSGHKNALVKRLKGALMLENLQKTSTSHVGLQPNSQIGEMSQNNFIKQYLAKQQELLRQRPEREAREASETNEQEDHTEVNNSTPSPAHVQDVTPASADHRKSPGPSDGEGLFAVENEGDANSNQEAHMSASPASGSVPMHIPGGGDHHPDKSATAGDFLADSDDDDSEDGEDDGDDEDWDRNIRRRTPRQPARGPSTRERCGASCQPQQQHIPSLLSPQLRQPTPPPSPPPEFSFPLPDTPKQSPPSPDVAPARRSPSSSSSGSSSSDSRSSSPEPQRSGHVERKPGPLTLLARKMESEGAFSGAGWHGGNAEGGRKDSVSPTAAEHGEGLISAVAHTASTTGHEPFSKTPGTINPGAGGAQSAHSHVPVSVLKASEMEESERELEAERERLRTLEQEQAMEEERKRAREREEREKALQLEKELALERERQEREEALAKEQEEREQALARERALELERQRALEQELLQRQREEREKELERLQALEREREEREKALEEERKEKEQIEREKMLEQERLEREKVEQERLEREKALELERLERERALEQERLERERALEQERLERERALEQERLERERALEQERLERERALEQERLERERALEQERLEREKALELVRLEKERALEQERQEKEKALEQERLEKERALEQERLEKERALEQERLEKERALEQERLEKERVLEQERLEREKALELERLEKERALEQERLEREKAVEQERLEQERQEQMKGSERERIKKLESDRAEEQRRLELDMEEKKKSTLDNVRTEEAVTTGRICEQESLEKEIAKELDTELPPFKCGGELGVSPPTPPLSTGPDSKRQAGDQEDANAPKPQSESQAAESRSPLSPTSLSSPQSSLKKFRFLRDRPIQPPTPSMVIKRPRTFSDTPPVSFSFGEQKEGHRMPAAQEDHVHQDGGAKPLGPVGSQSEDDPALNKNSSKESFTSQVSEDIHKDDSMIQEEPAREATETTKDAGPSSPVDATQWQGRDGKREEKTTRKRSSSNDSSSSESDSGSSSSRSSSSSSSSPDKTSISRSRREGKPQRNASPQRSMSAVAQDDLINQIPKASPYKRERSGEKTSPADDGASQAKKPFLESTTRAERKRNNSEGLEEKDELRKGIEPAMADSEKVPETSEETPKAFSARKISLGSSKSSPGRGSTDTDQESGTAGGRKRRWGSSTVVTVKKPSISITTDSLKSLIPDIKPCAGQDAIVDLYPEEAVLSGAEEEDTERSEQDLQIRRTVTQVVVSDSQENGQKEEKKSRREEVEVNDVQGDAAHEDKTSVPEDMETQSPSQPSQDVELSTVTTGETIIRRSISQQKTGVSITIDDPVRTNRQPSPPRGKVSSIVHVSNLVRPFTLGQLKELLGRTGTLVEDGFWIDKIKSHCYVTYSSSEEAVATREALHGVKWPQSNPKVLSVDFCQQEELDFHKSLGTADKPATEERWLGSTRCLATGLPSLLPERDQWAEREREMERREKARSEREWDRDKVREFGKPGEDKEAGSRRSRSRERRRKERAKSKEKKSEKKEKAAEEPPAKLLDDLFRKTKAAPCIYWLPLTEEQAVEREAARAERMKEREKRLKQQQEEKEKKREEERKERMKGGGVATGDRSEGEKDKDKDRERDRGKERDNDKRRDGYRRPGASGESGSRRSRSRSDPRDRRR
ncbi:apoptotic chromatin condensation inducer in the nucleus isoform X2 [Dunckerocampus dactyliophorus]|uniref:apoptotic chromatin condensation inducer in the nucleus isoform X2 n=1 Tax=Dunckerocampus dactyliophorus TaxID=161453 RepID=UPI002405C183|nr:apoptotic chromatin condensation inducer in the nucleus isoform X2 [Dunckerocampus dactyliophorus]